MAEFDRGAPIFERESVPFEVISADNTKSNELFTVRVLYGHRPLRNGSGREKIFRFEMSDECNLITTTSDFNQASLGCKTPNRQVGGLNSHRTPHPSVIHAPFMTANRGRDHNLNASVQYQDRGIDNAAFSQMQLMNKPSAVTNRTILLYELEVGESDFEELRRDQALLVDFDDFASSLISLMQYCWLEEGGDCSTSLHQTYDNASNQHSRPNSASQYVGSVGCNNAWNDSSGQADVHWGNGAWGQQQHIKSPCRQQHTMMRSASPFIKHPVSTYTCRLEVSSNASDANSSSQWRKNNAATSHARFSIVESNQFRELTHLALTLNVGTDSSIRKYLSCRLSQAMAQTADVNSQLEMQKQRCHAAERNAIEANKRLGDMAQAHEAEKYQLQCQAEERFQTENSCRFAEINNVKTSKDSEIQKLTNELQKCKTEFGDKIRALEGVNRTLSQEKSLCQSENERLTCRLNQQETSNDVLTNEVSSLRTRLERITDEKSITEKNLRELQVVLASLETSNNDHQNTISQTEAQIASTERVYIDAKQTISRQHSQIEELQRRLVDSETEASRYKELAGRYQVNRAEMKKRMKERAEIIRQHEEVIRAGEKEVADLKHRVDSLSGDLKRMQHEKDTAVNELSDSKKKMDEATKKLDNNQQVIAWLNKQLQSGKNNSGGVVWQGSTPKPLPRHESTPAAAPASNQTLPSVTSRNKVPSSSLSRYLPAATPATPEEIKQPVIVPKGLHPEPHPL